MGSSSVSMETSVIMHNIQRIVKVHSELPNRSSAHTHTHVRGEYVGVSTKRTNTKFINENDFKIECVFYFFL